MPKITENGATIFSVEDIPFVDDEFLENILNSIDYELEHLDIHTASRKLVRSLMRTKEKVWEEQHDRKFYFCKLELEFNRERRPLVQEWIERTRTNKQTSILKPSKIPVFKQLFELYREKRTLVQEWTKPKPFVSKIPVPIKNRKETSKNPDAPVKTKEMRSKIPVPPRRQEKQSKK